VKGFEAKYPDHDITQARIANAMEMLAKAIDAAGTADDVAAVAAKLEGMEHESIWGGSVYIRPEDHQAIQDVHIQAHTNEGITNALDNSEYGLLKVSTVEMAALDSETSCKMKRP
jgi:branched-chain amino acid transport system substrate-binding protein